MELQTNDTPVLPPEIITKIFEYIPRKKLDSLAESSGEVQSIAQYIIGNSIRDKAVKVLTDVFYGDYGGIFFLLTELENLMKFYKKSKYRALGDALIKFYNKVIVNNIKNPQGDLERSRGYHWGLACYFKYDFKKKWGIKSLRKISNGVETLKKEEENEYRRSVSKIYDFLSLPTKEILSQLEKEKKEAEKKEAEKKEAEKKEAERKEAEKKEAEKKEAEKKEAEKIERIIPKVEKSHVAINNTGGSATFKDQTLLELKDTYNTMHSPQMKKAVSDEIENKLIYQLDHIKKHKNYLVSKKSRLLKKIFLNNTKITKFIDNCLKNGFDDYKIFLKKIQKIQSLNNIIETSIRKFKNTFYFKYLDINTKYKNNFFKRKYYKRKFTSQCKKASARYQTSKKLSLNNKYIENIYNTCKELRLVKNIEAQFTYKKNSVEVVDNMDNFLTANKNVIKTVTEKNKRSKSFWHKITKPFRKIKKKFNSLFFAKPAKLKKTITELVNVVGNRL